MPPVASTAGTPRRTRPVGLRSRAEFQRVQSSGRRVRRAYVTLLGLRVPTDAFRIGYTVSRKVGNAVVRNRVRRKLREIVRLDQARVPSGFDFVLIAAPSAAQVDYAGLRADVLTAFDSARSWS